MVGNSDELLVLELHIPDRADIWVRQLVDAPPAPVPGHETRAGAPARLASIRVSGGPREASSREGVPVAHGAGT